jgi:dephospho-CoA kinase
MSTVIGLTGNIGTGKSSVLQMLADLGAQTIDADKLAHEVMESGGPAFHAVVATFGPDIVGPGGEIDRQRLGEIVFRYPQALTQLEALVHPPVLARAAELIAQTNAGVVAIEAIKLLESGMAPELCDQVWVVTCTPDQQLERVMAQRGLSEEDARRRMEAQPPQAEKVAQADVVIDNSGTPEETRTQVEAAWRAVVGEAPAGEAAPVGGGQADTTVRPATMEDAEGILHVLNTIVREKRFTALDRELTLEEEIEFLGTRGPRDAILVAESGGRVVAFQGVDPFMPAIASMSHVAQMGTYVLPSHRGQGIGRRLFEASCDFALQHGYRKIVIYIRAGNSEAQQFYQRLGFVTAGRLHRQTRIDGDFEDEILFEYFLEEA